MSTSRLAQKLGAGGFAVSLEITPPKKRLDDVLLRRARLLGSGADVVNVIQRPERMSSLDASLLLLEAGLEPVWHVVNRGRTRSEVASEIASAAAAGIHNALCIRGDHRGEDASDTPKIRDVIAMLRDAMPAPVVGATLNQYGPRERVLANLLPKLRAGASFVQTNPVLDLEALRPLAEEVKSRAPDTKLVPMVMPLVSLDTARRIGQRLSIPMPEAFVARLAAEGETAGWRKFEEIVAALVESPLADGVAVMTPVMDAPAPLGERIRAAIARATG